MNRAGAGNEKNAIYSRATLMVDVRLTVRMRGRGKTYRRDHLPQMPRPLSLLPLTAASAWTVGTAGVRAAEAKPGFGREHALLLGQRPRECRGTVGLDAPRAACIAILRGKGGALWRSTRMKMLGSSQGWVGAMMRGFCSLFGQHRAGCMRALR